jgi:hypothetical protein
MAVNASEPLFTVAASLFELRHVAFEMVRQPLKCYTCMFQFQICVNHIAVSYYRTALKMANQTARVQAD